MPALPLDLSALFFGVNMTVFISFATDRVVRAFGLEGLPLQAFPAVMFIKGIAGLATLGTAAIKDRIGLPRLVRGLLVVSALSLIAVLPTNWPGVAAQRPCRASSS